MWARARCSMPLPTVVHIAHGKGEPVIVDAAAMLPPAENLTRYVAMVWFEEQAGEREGAISSWPTSAMRTP